MRFRVKSTSYAENVRTFAYATKRHATEAIFLNTEGNVCEGTGTNIFVVIDGTISLRRSARGRSPASLAK